MPIRTGTVRDRSFFEEYDGKNIRFINGAFPLARTAVLFDHFTGIATLNSAVPQNWVQTETGAGGSKAIWAVASAAGGSQAVGVAGATTHNAEELAGKNVCWVPASQGATRPLVLEVRAKFVGATTATDGVFNIGWSDAVTQTNGLAAFQSASSAVTSVGVELCMFTYSSVPTSGAGFLAGGNPVCLFSQKNSVAGTLAATNAAVVKDSSFHVYRIEMDDSANASFYIDDKFVGAIAAATTAATALTPYVSVISENSHAETGTIDYIHVSGQEF